MSDIDILYQIANLKETDYKNTLLITSIIELLIENGTLTREKIIKKAQSLDNISISQDI